VSSNDVSPDITVIKTGNTYTLQSEFSSTQTISIDFSTTGSWNGSFTWVNAKLITGSSTQTIANGWDDITPLKISNSYQGGNHSDYVGKWLVRTTGHNKTAADLGSVWNLGGNNFTLVGIGVTALYFAAPFVNSNGFVTVSTAVPKNPVAYVRGGSEGYNTDAFEITTGSTVSKFAPSINNKSVKCFADGIEIAGNGTISCNELEIREQ